jgi:ATP-dependent RNA helicase DeaD
MVRGFQRANPLHGARPADGLRAERAPDAWRGGHAADGLRAERGPDAWRGTRSNDTMRDTGAGDGWVRFRVSWGQAQGADARRLLPMLCRRGNIRGSDIGAIELTPSFSLVEVATRVAADFERATQRPDPRDPAVVVRREMNDPMARQGGLPPRRQRPS